MLLGVRARSRDRARGAGHPLRVYVPYGARWYEYSLRRLQENPKVAGHVTRDVFRRVSQALSEKPPSTTRICPRTISASAEQRKATAAAMSSGVTSRPAGFRAPISSISSRFGKCSSAPVSTTPPDTALTRIPRGPSSTAR